MEWAIVIPILVLLLLCPLMMIGMIVRDRMSGRKSVGGHGGHGMMCMGHGGGSNETRGMGHETAPTVDELRAERDRLDEIIARAERAAPR